MEDYRIALLIGREQGGKVVDFLLPPFTLIGATTNLVYLCTTKKSLWN